MLSTSLLNLEQNGHSMTKEIVQEAKKKDISVVCNLKQAQWLQVYYPIEYYRTIQNEALLFRVEHSH